MLKLFMCLFISVTVSRWMYSEAQLVVPQIVPLIDYVVQATDIPTHDKWSKNSMHQILSAVEATSKFVVEKAEGTSTLQKVQQASPRNVPIKKNPLQELALLMGVTPIRPVTTSMASRVTVNPMKTL